MKIFKKYIFINLIIVIIFFGYNFFKTDSKAIKSTIENIQKEFATPPEKNIMKEAFSILKVCEYFDSEVKINIDNIQANSKKELQEMVSYAKQFLSPIESEIEYINFIIEKPVAFIVLKIKIFNSKNNDMLKKEYNLEIKFIKNNRKWFIENIKNQ